MYLFLLLWYQKRPKKMCFWSQKRGSVWTAEPLLPLSGGAMVRAITSAMPADCTTRWTDKTDPWSGLEKDWYGFRILN